MKYVIEICQLPGSSEFLIVKLIDKYSQLNEFQTTDPAELAVNKCLRETNFYMDKGGMAHSKTLSSGSIKNVTF